MVVAPPPFLIMHARMHARTCSAYVLQEFLTMCCWNRRTFTSQGAGSLRRASSAAGYSLSTSLASARKTGKPGMKTFMLAASHRQAGRNGRQRRTRRRPPVAPAAPGPTRSATPRLKLQQGGVVVRERLVGEHRRSRLCRSGTLTLCYDDGLRAVIVADRQVKGEERSVGSLCGEREKELSRRESLNIEGENRERGGREDLD